MSLYLSFCHRGICVSRSNLRCANLRARVPSLLYYAAIVAVDFRCFQCMALPWGLCALRTTFYPAIVACDFSRLPVRCADVGLICPLFIYLSCHSDMCFSTLACTFALSAGSFALSTPCYPAIAACDFPCFPVRCTDFGPRLICSWVSTFSPVKLAMNLDAIV